MRPTTPPLDLETLWSTTARLLERALFEFGEPDRPVIRLAAERCSANIAACAEQLYGAVHGPRGERAAYLRRAAQAIDSARCDLEIVHQRGAILPPAYRALGAGCEVIRRRVAEAAAGVAGAPAAAAREVVR